jgi:hypothetical protein
MNLIKEVFAALCAIIIELCRGLESFAKSFSEVGGSTHDYAKTLRSTEEQLQGDIEISRVERQIRLVEQLNKLKLRVGNDPKLTASIDQQLKAIEDTFK